MDNKIIVPALKIEICSLLSHAVVKTTQSFLCLLANEHFCVGCNLLCTMYLHGSENETGPSTCPYLPPFVMLPSCLSFVDFLHIFSDGKRHYNMIFVKK